MLDRGLDQAAGLRRLMAQEPPAPLRLLAFALPEDGEDAWVAPLAHALRAQGARPVVLDAGRGRLLQAFGVRARHDLLDMLQGTATFDAAAQCTGDGVWVLRADRGVEAFVSSGAAPRQLFEGFARLSHNFDAVLLAMPPHELACLAHPACAVPVIALEPGDDGLTRAYATLKELAGGYGYTRFSCVLPGAGHAAQSHERLAFAARRFLNAEVALAGRLDATPAARDAALEEAAGALLRQAATPLALH